MTSPSTPDIDHVERLHQRVCEIIVAAQTGVARTVNTAQVLSNWLIGRAIIEEEQQGQSRANYGENLLKTLSQKLKQDYGKGFSYANLKLMRQFYLAFPQLLQPDQKGYTLRSLFPNTLGPDQQNKIFASRYKLHLPTEAELQAELRRELSHLQLNLTQDP
jgi:hypothetical protein